MMGFWLLVPFFLLRFGLMAALNRGALARAAHFAPMQGAEQVANWVYQLANLGLLVAVAALPLRWAPAGVFGAGLGLYLAGCMLLAAAVAGFAAAQGGMASGGVYRLSRNPMYLAYFLVFWGCGLLTQSLLVCGLALAFQATSHVLICAEERWCAAHFGAAWQQYAQRVRRYL